MVELIFVRHGETDWSKTRTHRFRGRRDIPLNSTGILQAKAVGKRLSEYDIKAIYSSPLSRAKDTAKEIAKYQDVTIQEHDGFMDLDFGSWEGRLHVEIEHEQPELYKKWRTKPNNFRFPEGESLDELRARIKLALEGLMKIHNEDTIVISSHGAVIRIAMCFTSDVENSESWNFNMDNCAYTIVEYNNGKYIIKEFNNNSHLNIID
jgi:probable phosphoglycerate mutase